MLDETKAAVPVIVRDEAAPPRRAPVEGEHMGTALERMPLGRHARLEILDHGAAAQRASPVNRGAEQHPVDSHEHRLLKDIVAGVVSLTERGMRQEPPAHGRDECRQVEALQIEL